METTKTCKKCSENFQITKDDQEFYSTIGVPKPTHCPDCRQQRRLYWRNERNLHYRKCSATGEKIMSVFSSEAAFPVYKTDYWYSDKWSPLDYGMNFDFSRSFFEQFEKLINKVPQLALSVTGNQNCDYVNQCGWCKNCYLIFEADNNENCMYSSNLTDSKSCLDCLNVQKTELSYQCIDCSKSYNLKFSQDCINCSDSWFLKNCIGCKNCFGCVNIRNKQYYFLNQKLSKKEYEEKIKTVDLQTAKGLEAMRQYFQEHIKKFPQKHYQGNQNENSTGNYLNNTQNCQYCFDTSNSQDSKYLYYCRNMKKCYDISVFGSTKSNEFCYECHEIGQGVRNILFSDQVWDGCYDITYSKLCLNNCHHLFGCVGMKQQSYCIFNKQYSPEEYKILREKIIEHMKKTGEWGEFFPPSLSPFPYHETQAEEYFPLNKENSENLDKLSKKNPQPIGGEHLQCHCCQNPYKITAAEEQFYKIHKLPIPHECQRCRYKKRFKLRNPRTLWQRTCQKCQKTVQTSFSPERQETIYCENCYNEEAN